MVKYSLKSSLVCNVGCKGSEFTYVTKYEADGCTFMSYTFSICFLVLPEILKSNGVVSFRPTTKIYFSE